MSSGLPSTSTTGNTGLFSDLPDINVIARKITENIGCIGGVIAASVLGEKVREQLVEMGYELDSPGFGTSTLHAIIVLVQILIVKTYWKTVIA